MHRDGYEIPIELAVTQIKVQNRYEFIGFICKIAQRKESEDLIWKQANFDTLTKLPNRHMFLDRLDLEIKKAHRAGLFMALLFIDLNDFKKINDTLGHNAGELLLVEAARRLNDCVRESDTVARLGGDEFTMILSELGSVKNVSRITETILREMAQPFLLQKERHYVSASIGITLYPEDATDANGLLKNADHAMYAAKKSGKNRFNYFTQSMQDVAQTRQELSMDLREAVATKNFTINYQPIVNLKTGRIEKTEALVRWQHPELGLISPDQFIPLAEETRLIIEIGDWVFREAARQLKRDMSLGNSSHYKVSVNMSPVQFRDAGNLTINAWGDFLQDLGLPEKSIIIEITEGLLLDASKTIVDKLHMFRNADIQISIDDFCTGYSALSYLKKFDIDYLKIDRSFVRDLETDANDRALREAIVMMAHKLGLKVIAEGVETEGQRRLLADTGCDYGQRYLFFRPLPTDEFTQLLKDHWSESDKSGSSIIQGGRETRQ